MKGWHNRSCRPLKNERKKKRERKREGSGRGFVWENIAPIIQQSRAHDAAFDPDCWVDRTSALQGGLRLPPAAH